MAEQATIAGEVRDFEDASKDLEEITEDERAQAKGAVSQESLQKADSHINRVKEHTEKREREEQASNNRDPETNYANYVIQLKSILAPEMARKKAELEEAQCTFLTRALSLFGYRPKPVKDDAVLEIVVKEQVRGLEEHTVSLNVARDARKNDYAHKQQKCEAFEKGRNEDFDLFEDSEKQLKSLEEQLTVAIKSKDQYLVAKHQPNYNGEVDTLLKNSLDTISEFSSRIRKIKEGQRKLRRDLSRDVMAYKMADSQFKQAEYHFDVVEQELDTTKLVRDLLVDMLKDEADRKSLIDMYKTIMDGKKRQETGEKILAESNKLLNRIHDLVKPEMNADRLARLLGEDHQRREHETESQRRYADALEEARAMRYGLLDKAA